MSLLVLKAGLLDTIQDGGRTGYAHLSIPTSGAMDPLALQLANALVGNAPAEAVLEMHFPAPALRFETDAVFALAGADFDARAAGTPLPLNTPVIIRAGTELVFQRPKSGARCYLAVRGGFALEPWLGSCSTDLAAQAGGWQGRPLRAADRLPLRRQADYAALLAAAQCRVMPWSARPAAGNPGVRFLPGPEYDYLTTLSQQLLETAHWPIAPQSDRMGYRTSGPALALNTPLEMVSAAVMPGTLQLLPDGHFVVLMAGCQTTGGYPRIGHIIGADLPKMAQLRAGERFQLEKVDLETAVATAYNQENWLRRIAYGASLKWNALV